MDITAALSRHPDEPFSLEPVTLDAPREDEVLVRMVASGVCHTDLHYRSRLPPAGGPYVLGHEGAGIVEETGSGVIGIRPGERVVLSYRHCGACAHCRAGRIAYCVRYGELNAPGSRPDGTYTLHRDGGGPVAGTFFGQSSFATHVLASADNTVVVDRTPTSCPPLRWAAGCRRGRARRSTCCARSGVRASSCTGQVPWAAPR
ncbi:alcohol dehydrogenase catalytic domain-containing protein [Streptomyces xiangluensis]|uniref:Alcohol dehydrogenase catalytic domain-containing protein n=1 Tax=Streptomyces xiangluensis TaxID=2665720 RepID=A0ABV8YZW2_9ACTN